MATQDPRKSQAAVKATAARRALADDPRVLAANTPAHQPPGATNSTQDNGLLQVPRTSVNDDDMVTAVVPRNFIFTCDDSKQIHYKTGIQDMPRNHAEHWFSKAQGVEIRDE